MLQQMRDWNRYLKWVLIIVVFMFVVWAFASWTGAVFGVKNETLGWAAQVNGTNIDGQAFQNLARQLDSTYQSIFGAQYAQQRGMIRIGRQAIEQLVDDEIMYQEALRRGLSASTQEIADAITREPSFQENGHFIGLDRYRALFRGSRMSVSQFEDSVRHRLIIDKYRSLIGSGVTVSEAEVEQELLRRNQKISVDYVVIDPKQLPGAPAAGDAEVAGYYAAHTDRYRRGEGRTGQYVSINPADLAASISVTDAEIDAAYARDLQARYTVREQRRASHVLLKVPADASKEATAKIEAKARGLLKRAKAGEDFAALARANSEDSTAASGGDLNFFGRGQMVKEFEDAAFATPVQGVSDLVRTTYGFHIIKVTDARQPRVMPIEEVRDQIREDLRMTRARAAAQERAAGIATAAKAGHLDTVARSQNLTLVETGSVHAGEPLAGAAGSQMATTRMLAMQPGQVSDAIAIAGGLVVVQVTGTTPDVPRPLAEIRSRVEKDLTDERALAAVKGAVGGAGPGASLTALARRFKTELKTQNDLARGASLPGLPADPKIQDQLETLAVGTIGEPVAVPSGIVLLSVRERNDHKDLYEGQRDSTRDSLLQQRRERLVRTVVRQLRDQGRVAINDSMVDAIDRS